MAKLTKTGTRGQPLFNCTEPDCTRISKRVIHQRIADGMHLVHATTDCTKLALLAVKSACKGYMQQAEFTMAENVSSVFTSTNVLTKVRPRIS